MDIEYFIKKQNILLAKVPLEFIRERFFKILNSNERLIGLIGARGVGKSTLLLQYLKNSNLKGLYFLADDIMFQDLKLVDVAQEFYSLGGRLLIIDEIHKYKNWAQEVKNIYDSYPDMLIRFSGSSQLNILYEKFDLSRRAAVYKVPVFSFREFLELKKKIKLQSCTLDEILKNGSQISTSLALEYEFIYAEFKEYLKYGAYPFFLEGVESFNKKLFKALEKVIYEDIPSVNRIEFSHLIIFKKIIYKMVKANKPYKVNIASLSKELGISEPTLYTYLEILESSGIAAALKKYSKKISKKPNKLLFANSNIYNAYTQEFDIETDIGTQRETFFATVFKALEKELYYSDIGDFRYKDYIFEIGGKNKSFKQIEDIKNSYLVIDTNYTVTENKIPLWLFGFLY